MSAQDFKKIVKDTLRFLRFEPHFQGKNAGSITRNAVLRNFKYVKLSKAEVDLSHFPDFMIVGPQRTGTTWLYDNLRENPQIFLSATKEIFYFNLLNKPNSTRYRSNDLAWYLSFFYDTPEEHSRKNMNALTKFGEPYQPKVRGEATAGYAVMDVELIREVSTLNPDIKIILMVRNPVERAWSHAKYFFTKESNRTLKEVHEKEFADFFNQEYQLSCGGYTGIVKNWSPFLKEGNIFIGLFDDISKSPERLLLRLFDFLGVRSDPKYISPSARERINPTEAVEIPPKYRRMLEDTFRGELESLKQNLGFSWEMR